MRVVIVHADAERRSALAQQLRQGGHQVEALDEPPAARASQASPGAEVAILAGPQAIAHCEQLRPAHPGSSSSTSSSVTWILAIVAAEQIEAALAAGANDCLIAPASPAELELRLKVALTSALAISRDASTQQRIHSQMFLADRLATVGTLTVGVAHEINNPLSWVIGNLGLLSDEFDNQVRMREIPGHDEVAVAASRARVRELVGRAQEGTERVRRIVRDLGRFGRADDEDGQLVDLHALLDSAIEIADVQLRHRAQVARDYRCSGYARGGEARLGQVFLNLLVNAGQAIEPGSQRSNCVRVETCDLDDGRVEVAVSDTGCGMPEQVRARIFEPFFTTKPAGEGTGIGLAISLSIVNSMGGEIVVESQVGQGTTFRVRLPAAAGAASEELPSSSAPALREPGEDPGQPKALRVLIVDDEPLIREMVCDALAQHQVTAVSNGRDALEQVFSADWDLILCDMVLPGLTGLDVYREIEARRPEILGKLVLMTGGDFSRKELRLPSGAQVRRLDKPFSIKALRALALIRG